MRVGMGGQLITPRPHPWEAEGCPASDPYPHFSRKQACLDTTPGSRGAQALVPPRQQHVLAWSDSTLAFLGWAPLHTSHNPSSGTCQAPSPLVTPRCHASTTNVGPITQLLRRHPDMKLVYARAVSAGKARPSRACSGKQRLTGWQSYTSGGIVRPSSLVFPEPWRSMGNG